MHGSEANAIVTRSCNTEHGTATASRQVHSLHNIVDQAYRAFHIL